MGLIFVLNDILIKGLFRLLLQLFSWMVMVVIVVSVNAMLPLRHTFVPILMFMFFSLIFSSRGGRVSDNTSDIAYL